MKKVKSGATEGRILHRRWSFLGFSYRSDTLSHDYMRRWTLTLPTGHMIRVHKILRSDDRTHYHDHPFDFVSFILKGGYVEYSGTTVQSPPDREAIASITITPKITLKRTYLPGSIVRRRAEDLHALELLDGPAWTLVFAGPIRREWGFETSDGWIEASKYDDWKRSKIRAVR